MRALVWMIGCVMSGTAALGQPSPQSAGARPSSISTDVRCAAGLGTGAKSRRQFCDVLITPAGAESISLAIPAHAGPSTLRFDLHNRFVASDDDGQPAARFARHAALVAVVGAGGAVLARAAVTGEFRTVQDLFDRIAGGPHPGGVKGVAPGPAEAITVAVPEAHNVVGIIGLSIEERTAAGTARWTTPGRPVAIASNFRIEYIPQ